MELYTYKRKRYSVYEVVGIDASVWTKKKRLIV